MKYEITGYDHFGRGITKIDGKITFVPKVLKGDFLKLCIVKEKKHYNIAKREDQKEYPSVFCPHFFSCGGCMLQQMDKEEERIFKKEKVIDIFQKYGHLKVDPCFLSTSRKNYRNKVIFHIEKNKIGFYEEESHTLLEIDTCPVLKKEIEMVLGKMKEYIQQEQGLTKVMIRSLGNEIMVCVYGNTNKERLIKFFSFVTSLYYNDQLLYGKEKLQVLVLGKKFYVSKDAFFQVNDIGIEKIYQEVLSFLQKEKRQTVFDLYCGVGTLSLLASPFVKKVIGVEIVPNAILDAKENAKINKITNVSFFVGKVEEILPSIKEKIDTVILDPPRSGLDRKTRGLLLHMNLESIIYVSCDVMTLARDLKELSHSYLLKEIKMIDEFPNTYHVECVTYLVRRQK